MPQLQPIFLCCLGTEQSRGIREHCIVGWARNTNQDHLVYWLTCKRACLNIMIVASLALRHTVEDGRTARFACICHTGEQSTEQSEERTSHQLPQKTTAHFSERAWRTFLEVLSFQRSRSQACNRRRAMAMVETTRDHGARQPHRY